MLSTLFPRAHARYAAVPIVGLYLEGLCVWLKARGYPHSAIQRRMQAAKFLAAALHENGVHSLGELTAPSLRSYVPPPGESGSPARGPLVRSLTDYLDERGDLVPTPPTAVQDRVADYVRYLGHVRGLSTGTVAMHAATVARYLLFVEHEARSAEHVGLRATVAEAFLVKVGQDVGRSRMGQITAVLRSYLRFLAATGQGPAGLDAHIDSPRIYRGERFPRALPWETVRTLLRVIDRTTLKGLRDYAMFLLIASYGLRASEVRALRLDDIHWRIRQIRVPRPKVGTALLLPLIDDIGAAILAYLRGGRPDSTDRHLFLRVESPLGPLGRGAIGDAFRAWARRAEIALSGRCGPHSIRHALAVHLLREGASLKTIGDLLGHRSAESTGIYLRLDVDDLRDVALPLPAAATAEEVQP